MKRFLPIAGLGALAIGLIALLAINDADSDVPEPYGGTYDRRGSYEPVTDLDVPGAEFSDTGDALDTSAAADSAALGTGELPVADGPIRPVDADVPAGSAPGGSE